MPQDSPTAGRYLRIATAIVLALAACLVCPAVAWADSLQASLALSSQICATGDLQHLAPHLVAFVALMVLVAITLRGEIQLCLEYFPLDYPFRRIRRSSQNRRRSRR